jgi:hypothetical protein
VITTRPPRKNGRVGLGENAGGAIGKKAPQVTRQEKPQPDQTELSAAKNGNNAENSEPIHPYATAPDATNSTAPGPATRPLTKEPNTNRHEAAYATIAKIWNPQIARSVYKRAMETPITLTQRELLSLSPEVRAQVAEVTIKKRVPRDQSALVMIEEIPDEEEPISRKTEETRDKYKPAAFVVTARMPPDNATIIADPYEVFLRENACATHPAEPVQVAAESNALRAILPVVDGQDKVEAILDPGCQIVAMSEEVCNALALPYDPTIRLSMVSANGGVNQSLKLARNVPFVVGEITLYLQVHVLRAPAYDILLGRPFDVLMQSVVHNFADENQTVTILDPNTGRKATIPTIPRGSFRFADRRSPIDIGSTKTQDF